METEIKVYMYAILDIETTGGKYNEEGITEIAIYRYDGLKIVDQLSSLINPLRDIQPFVQRLTGINSKMLVNAPKFYELAKRIIEITKGCIIVAHNAEFDYRILQTEYNRLGYSFVRKSLCTVALSKKLLPDIKSYKLGKLVRSLGIPISDQHRAYGDALATLKLFKLLLEKDSTKEIISAYVRVINKRDSSSKFLNLLEGLPSETGVYYLYNKKGEIIYIGKSRNIKKRVSNHLTKDTPKATKIQSMIARVSFELSGNECLALLKEQNEIKKNQPPLNHALKQKLYPVGIYINTIYSYHKLIIENIKEEHNYLQVFKNKNEAIKKIETWIEEFTLCENHTSLKKTVQSCFAYKIKKCKGACIENEAYENYNARVLEIQKKMQYPYKNMLIIDKGKSMREKSFILIKDSIFRGYGYFKLNHQIKTLEAVEKRLISIDNNRDTQAIVQSFIQRKRYKEIINLDLHSL